ncbi:MAG: hypothetical protein H7Y15_19295 [Pseudonocardia sp.]|nr:hypothetical protein [Pseudonocardia sp.]
MTLLPRTALAVLVLLTTGCGAATTASPSVSGQSELSSALEQARELLPGDVGTGTSVDACALLPGAEVEALIGPDADPVLSPPIGDGGQCTWEDTDTYFSVTLDIGSTGTAANGLPPWEPVVGPEVLLPDEMRSWGGGQVEFVANGRSNFVQVVTADLGGDADEQEAIRLAGMVRDQL